MRERKCARVTSPSRWRRWFPVACPSGHGAPDRAGRYTFLRNRWRSKRFFHGTLRPGESARAADRILEQYRSGNDDALVLVSRLTGISPCRSQFVARRSRERVLKTTTALLCINMPPAEANPHWAGRMNSDVERSPSKRVSWRWLPYIIKLYLLWFAMRKVSSISMRRPVWFAAPFAAV